MSRIKCMYAVPGGCVVHRTQHCVRLSNSTPYLVQPSPTLKRCRSCFPVDAMCLICTTTSKTRRTPCGDHVICQPCLEDYVDVLSQQPTWNGNVTCPCGNDDDVTFPSLPLGMQSRINATLHERRTSVTSPSTSHVDGIVDRILTERCPHCDAAFCDFSGCIAVECRCKGFFCGLCLRTCTGSDECHSHVQLCRMNPNVNEYYVTFNEWLRIRHDSKCRCVWGELHRIFKETDSIVYTCGILIMLHRIDSLCLFPHALRCMSRIPTVFLYMLILIVYPYVFLQLCLVQFARLMLQFPFRK